MLGPWGFSLSAGCMVLAAPPDVEPTVFAHTDTRRTVIYEADWLFGIGVGGDTSTLIA